MKRLKLILVAIALSITSTVSCYAVQPYFKDVPTVSKYYQGITYLKDNKIINGTGGGYFRPNDYLHYKDYLVMLNNYNGYGYNLYKYIVYGDVIEFLDINHLIQGKYMAKIDVLRQACLALDIEPYSAKFYDLPADFSKFSALEQNEEDIIFMCSQLGIIDLSEESYETMTNKITRGEAAKIFSELIKLDKQGITFEMPESAKNIISLEYADEVKDRSSTVPLLNDVADLPSWLVDSYNAKGMKITVLPFSVADNDNKIAGRYHTKTGITVNSSRNYVSTIPHEFGHHLYYEYVVDICKKSDPNEAVIQRLFNAEKDAMVDYYREYGGINYKEYFAEFFVLYLKAYDEGTTAELQEVMPQTYAYMDELIKSLGGL